MKCLQHVTDRGSRCYELASMVMFYDEAKKFTVVHGFAGRAHAWIETGDGMVYDTTDDKYTPVDVYGGSAEFRYSQTEVLTLIRQNNTMGPWHWTICGIDENDAVVDAGYLLLRGKKSYDAFDANKRCLVNFPRDLSRRAQVAIFAASPNLCASWRMGNGRDADRFPLPVVDEAAIKRRHKPIKCLKRIADAIG